MCGSVCGGVMSESQMFAGMKKHGAYYGMMAWTLADKHYKKYVAYLKAGKKKQADKVFERYAISSIG